MKFNPKFWQKATDARQELESQLKDRSDVCFVDIGYPQDEDPRPKEISLRVHVRKDANPTDHRSIPTNVGGISVVTSTSKQKRQKK